MTKVDTGAFQALSSDELLIRGGNPIAVAIGAYVGLCALGYYIGYGAHYAYNQITK